MTRLKKLAPFVLAAMVVILFWFFGKPLFVYCLYLNSSRCEPYVRSTVEEALDKMRRVEYSNLKDKAVYENEEEYNQIRVRAGNVHSMKIVDWDWGGYAYVDLVFKDGKKYNLLVVPASYQQMEFKIFLFRELGKKRPDSKI